MKIRFTIDYHTHWGQNVMICGNIPELGTYHEAHALGMSYKTGDVTGKWYVEIEIPQSTKFQLAYRYFVQEHGSKIREWGEPRQIIIDPSQYQYIVLEDCWRASDNDENALWNAAFQNALLPARDTKISCNTTIPPVMASDEVMVQFQICVPRLKLDQQLCILGTNSALGEWDISNPIFLENKSHPLWVGQVVCKSTDFPIEYKYAIYHTASMKIQMFEQGENRILKPEVNTTSNMQVVRTDEKFRFSIPSWKGAGVAIPVFSLRTHDSFGVGEFLDLKKLVDWANKTGLKLIQILPINDTTANFDWGDCYPYASISVFALHPIYLNLQAIGNLSSELTQKIIEQRGKSLNDASTLAYAKVIQLKFRFLRQIYQEQKEVFLGSLAFKTFYTHNKHWLAPYGAFSYLRDLYGTPDFSTWEDHAYLSAEELERFVDDQTTHYEEIAFYYFLQFHADKQLREATNYARQHGVVLKGDIAIGIFRNSVDAWYSPELFNMDGQAGAPPDDFSEVGQNWKFPTYNWEAMKADDYAWWTKRLQQMAHYFDAFRIDHILGFFRIWEIPKDYTEGLMGAFNKSLPVTKEELAEWGIWFDYERLCTPYIRSHFLHELFGEYVHDVKHHYLEEYRPNVYRLKPHVDTQRKVEELLTSDNCGSLNEKIRIEKIKKGLLNLHGEVIFLNSPNALGEKFNPRNAMQQTKSFQELDRNTQSRLHQFYNHYFYERHETFWRNEGLQKLPILRHATKMLICGEDLGMVPNCVPTVMREMEMLSLEVQRMPKSPRMRFGDPAHYPYLSVATPSSHDTSTIRGWWEEDPKKTQDFYNKMLHNTGNAPFYAEPWIVRDIILQHLYAPSMWAIFPIQDLIGIDAHLRLENPHAERINEPSNPNHRWCYRLHLSIEELLAQDHFNATLHQFIEQSGRCESSQG